MNKLVISIAILLFSSTISFSQVEKDKNLTTKKISKLIEIIERYYVDSVNSPELVDAAINAMLEKLDPHSAYIPAKRVNAVEAPLKGNFEGVGVRFQILNDTLMVVAAISGGPSEKVGVMAGDQVIKIDDETVAGVGLKNSGVRSRLLGKKGTKVTMTVRRSGEKDLIDFEVTRDKIPIYSLDAAYMIDDEIGYIKINAFARTTEQEFIDALEKLSGLGMKSLILDLQNNGGGYLDQAFKLADQFLSNERMIVFTDGRSYKRENYVATEKGGYEKGKLVVLVNEGTASASEIVSGAIQDWDRGAVVGRRTFGKGLVQQQMPLGGGDQIRLTTARYYTPTGRSIQRPYDSTSRDDYYAEVQERYKTGEMQDETQIPINDSLVFTTPKGRKVYGGGGISPDLYISNEESPDEMWNNYFLRSNVLNNFIFLEMDANPQKYNFENAAQFFNEPLPFKEDFMEAFKTYCTANGFPIEINNKNEAIFFNSAKAFIAIQLFGENLYNRIVNQKDPFIRKALDAIGAS